MPWSTLLSDSPVFRVHLLRLGQLRGHVLLLHCPAQDFLHLIHLQYEDLFLPVNEVHFRYELKVQENILFYQDSLQGPFQQAQQRGAHQNRTPEPMHE